MKSGNIIVLLLFILASCQESAPINNGPRVKIDFSQDGRKVGEVGEYGYEFWNNFDAPISKTYEGVTFTLSKEGETGEGLKSSWYKVGTSTSKLASDGVTVENGNDGAAIKLTISGLKAGKHSLLAFLNNIDSPKSNTFAPIDIYVDGKLSADNIQPSVRVLDNADSQTEYIVFEAKEGQDVEFVFEADKASDASNKNVILCGIELNTPNVKEQATKPYPTDADEHVDADNGKITLSWTPSPNAAKHMIYLSFRKDELDGYVDQFDSVYIGETKENSMQIPDIKSHKTYYWRVDEVDKDGQITEGKVWYFRPRHLAFPGAEGYGRFARGGRSGKVVEVTNLNDDGPGSFREAVNNDIGPRTIVFTVGGNIELKSRLIINQPYITVAGQTAPGEGITLTRAPVGLTGNDNIMRFMRVRIGSGKTYDGMGLTGANHSIIDHASISWTIDESFSSRGAHNITLQRTLISEALNKANHHKYSEGKMHGFAATVGGDVGSFHHNLLAHNYGRNWSIGGGLSGDGYYTGRVDIRNNVVYNWGRRATDGGAHEVNFVGNYYKPGPATSFFYALNMQHEGVGKGSQRAYFANNVMTGYFDESNQEDGRKQTTTNNENVGYETFVDEPFFESYVETQSAKAAYKDVMSDVGCTQPLLDSHDQRIVKETIDSTYTNMGSLSKMGGMIDTEKDSGGFPNYKTYKREDNWDTDHDGLPNWWEEAKGLNPNSEAGDFSDSNRDDNDDGFTELEDYLAWLAMPHFFEKADKKFTINLADYFKGYQKYNPEYELVSSNGASISFENGVIEIESIGKGFAYFTIEATDKEGDSKLREFTVFYE
ncbi:MAG: polysaccharide lyase family 1 protein [Mangrovibacterium sp.]